MKIFVVLLAVASMAFALPTPIEYSAEQLDPLAEDINQNTEDPNLELPEGIAGNNQADSNTNEDTNGNAVSGPLKFTLFYEEVGLIAGVLIKLSELMPEAVKDLEGIAAGNPADFNTNEETNGNAIGELLKPSIFDEEVGFIARVLIYLSELMPEDLEGIAASNPADYTTNGNDISGLLRPSLFDEENGLIPGVLIDLSELMPEALKDLEGITAGNPAHFNTNEETNGNAIDELLKPLLFDEGVGFITGVEIDLSELMPEVVKDLEGIAAGNPADYTTNEDTNDNALSGPLRPSLFDEEDGYFTY